MEKKKPTKTPKTPKKAVEEEQKKPSLSPEQVAALLDTLGIKVPTQEDEDPANDEAVEEASTEEAPKVEAPEAPVALPQDVMVELPNFLSLFVVGRLNRPDSPQHGQLFTKILGEVDLVRLAGLIEYSVQFKNKLFHDFLYPKPKE